MIESQRLRKLSHLQAFTVMTKISRFCFVLTVCVISVHKVFVYLSIYHQSTLTLFCGARFQQPLATFLRVSAHRVAEFWVLNNMVIHFRACDEQPIGSYALVPSEVGASFALA